MFERIVFRELPRRVARRWWYSVLASVIQGTVLGSALWASAAPVEPRAEDLSTIQIRFFPGRSAGGTRRGGVAAAVPRAARPAGLPGRRPGAPGGKGIAKVASPPAPMALVQPRELPAELRMPKPGEVGDGIAWEGELDEGDDEGVIGGGSFAEAEASELAVAESAGGYEEAPQWYTSGFRRPEEVDPGCVARNIRLPTELAGFVASRITVKFAVGRDGAVREAMVLGAEPDPRITVAIQRALLACRFRAGADARGQAISMWVILPLRFEGGT